MNLEAWRYYLRARLYELLRRPDKAYRRIPDGARARSGVRPGYPGARLPADVARALRRGRNGVLQGRRACPARFDRVVQSRLPLRIKWTPESRQQCTEFKLHIQPHSQLDGAARFCLCFGFCFAVDLDSAAEEAPVECSVTGVSSTAPPNLSTIIAPPLCVGLPSDPTPR
jgi:hypothetical protein